MKKFIIPVLFLVLATSCATIKVSSDYDKSAQFAQYKTYALTPEVQNLPIEELNRKRLITAIETELGKKGFTKSETPDIFIDVKITGEKKETATATSTGGYGYGGGYRYGWGGGYGGGTTYINYDTYLEGTIFIEMADAAKKELVWQGRGVGTINPDASAKKREENINYAIKMIFMQYPPKAK